MKKQELVSIVIPAFNVEYEIKKCIDNLVEQTYTNYEVIIVDDGSTDKTKEICDLLEKNNDKIFVIHQENVGVSAARNAGIMVAKGTWIVFLDADDRMAPEAIESALILAEEKDCDTVCWNYYSDCDGKIEKYPAIVPDEKIYQSNQMHSVLIEALYNTRVKEFYPGQMFRAVWGKLLSADVIRKNAITFPVGLPLGEDAVFLADYFQVCGKVLLVDCYWSYYKISALSAVGKYKSNLKEIQSKELEAMLQKIQTKDVDVDTILLNQYLQFDYQFAHNLFKKKNDLYEIYSAMLRYIKNRNYDFKQSVCYDKKKIHKQSIPVAWTMIKGLNHVEAALCIFRELRHQKCR
ncbi:glycosyltransferase [Anaerocolumna sedimenticola]|uniref:Glycosyltransferase n=1 Tax=Anaerocolumna sedimenticola TaxID=2696063 RepID=A0A6P1TKY0_9FIRM|nr:glycosyltransferase family 2 protein [Anaerocolumna sedimenticola]QHQ59958.1 glycosyltransferase [Anaerocolumna sedimenticola]